MKVSGSVVWEGAARGGRGEMNGTTRPTRRMPYDSAATALDTARTSPEELIALAHAGCFSLALSEALDDAGFIARRITTTATITLKQMAEGRTVTGILLDVVGSVPGAAITDFIDATVLAKVSCTVSRLLNVNISMKARLDSRAS
jgi:lipoyl-dependent peroxiredoxin